MSRSSLSQLSHILAWVALIHTLAFMAFWLTNNLFYASTNDYLVKLIGLELDYVSLLLVVSALIAAWSGMRLAAGRLGRTHKMSSLEAWLYGIVSILYVIFFYGSFQLLFKESPVQLVRLGQLLAYFRIILDTLLILTFALWSAAWIKRALRKRTSEPGRKDRMPVFLALLFLALLWSLPLVFPPGSVVRGKLPDKPQLIAHRGASMLAPENTLAAMQAAVDLGVYGLETDFRLSREGELFLMHDDTFKRTTDVKTVFPGRENERVENFALSEVRQLNAGKWFVEQDPFQAIKRGLVNPEQEKIYQQQAVPALAEMLEVVRSSQGVFIFDLKQPPAGHPYTDSFFDISLAQIKQAGIDPQVWFLVDEAKLKKLRQLAPEMKTANGANYKSPPSAEGLKAQGYQIVNVEYGIPSRWIEAYQDAGLWVNIYTIDESWQFSRLWLQGVNSITSSNAHVLVRLDRPVFSIPYGWFAAIWILVGLIGVGLIICPGGKVG
jgi:glycerophosphoryl diester phosphodiesterase